jgi:hypothetical protein
MYYIGVHRTHNIRDAYMGSGVRLNKTIKERCTKEILEFFTSETEMFKREQEVVNDTVVNDPMSYNMMIGGWGGDTISMHPNKDNIIAAAKSTMDNKSKKEKQEINDKKGNKGERNGMFGVHRTGPDNPMFGKSHSKQTRDKISEKAKARAQDPNYINPNKGNKLTEEHKQIISERNSRIFLFKYGKAGNIFKITNLSKFCRDHKLSECSMRHVSKGRYKQHKGYYSGVKI